jgi:hypothetical protein
VGVPVLQARAPWKPKRECTATCAPTFDRPVGLLGCTSHVRPGTYVRGDFLRPLSRLAGPAHVRTAVPPTKFIDRSLAANWSVLESGRPRVISTSTSAARGRIDRIDPLYKLQYKINRFEKISQNNPFEYAHRRGVMLRSITPWSMAP